MFLKTLVISTGILRVLQLSLISRSRSLFISVEMEFSFLEKLSLSIR